MRSVVDSCQVTTPQATRSTGTPSRPTADANDCLCPFLKEGGFEIEPDKETEYFNDFKVIVEDRFRNQVEFTRSRFFMKSFTSFAENFRRCNGRDLSYEEYKKMLYRLGPFLTSDEAKGNKYYYAKICLRSRLFIIDDSFTLINRIFNNDEKLFTIYKFEKDYGIFGDFRSASHIDGKAYEGMYQGLAMDNFLRIHRVLDPRNYSPELSTIGYRPDFFKHLAFVMLLHEIAEGHFAQNLGFYKSRPEYLEIDQWVESDDPYVAAHLMALKAQANELRVDMCRSEWIDMDEREGEGDAYEVRMHGPGDMANKNGAECLVTYKRQINGTYIKCTYAFRIKSGKFYNEKTVPGRRWENTFGCVMMNAPDANRTVMTGVISGATYRYEMNNYIKRLNDGRIPRKSPRSQLGPEPLAPNSKPNSKATPSKRPKKDQTVIWPILN